MSVPTRQSPRPRRRRTYLRADARRAQILDVAKDVFVGRGYRVANVADICKAARIGRGTLYQYFENKQAVLVALMEDITARIRKVLAQRPRIDELPAIDKAPFELVVRFCQKRLREILDAVFVDEATLRLILRDARGIDGAVDRMINMIDQLMLGAIEADTRAAQKAGLLREGSPRLIALWVIGGMEKMVLDALSRDEPVDRDAIIETAVQMQLVGLLKEVRR